MNARREAGGDVVLDRDICYRALLARDARFDGRFFTAVVSTGIYCRPICPARTPKLENCLFLPSAGAAHEMGFRPCLRCRPEVAPGLAGWRGSANTVSRALGLIAEGGFEGGADDLAERLGVGSRHLRRLFERYVGASPVSVAQAHRLLFAKKLLGETTLGMSEIALASGFGSVRRFNDAFKHAYGRPPGELRRAKGRASASESKSGALVLELPFTPPYDFGAILAFLGARAIPEVERVVDDRYERAFAEGETTGSLSVHRPRGKNHLVATIHMTEVKTLALVVAKLRRLFDLDADIHTIDQELARDPDLAARVKARPGIRVPGAWDPFELAVRAVLGQQISVAAATTLAGRLAASFGGQTPHASGLRRLFPSARALARADLGRIGLTRTRAATLNALATAVVSNERLLSARDTLESTVEALSELPGVGPWTAHYICMRALREPDAFPTADLGLLRAMRMKPAELEKRAAPWRPWRAYAAMRLWTQP